MDNTGESDIVSHERQTGRTAAAGDHHENVLENIFTGGLNVLQEFRHVVNFSTVNEDAAHLRLYEQHDIGIVGTAKNKSYRALSGSLHFLITSVELTEFNPLLLENVSRSSRDVVTAVSQHKE